MTATPRAIGEVLERAELPRSRYYGRPGEPRWTFGWGISQAEGQVTVWCNPGGPSAEAWHRSEMLAARIDQVLTVAGYPTYRDRDRDPQQVIVMGPARPLRIPRLDRRSKVASAAGVLLAAASLIVNGPGLALAAAVALSVAVAYGVKHDRTRREILATAEEGSTP